MKEEAIEKLRSELKAGSYDRYARIMKDDVCRALEDFCRQDEEFAQAVVQGGNFTDCMKDVARNCGNGISDLEAFRRAVQFYFPGSDIRCSMTIDLCASVRTEDDFAPAPEPAATAAPAENGKQEVVLSLDDFL